jgi:hypothetical protein
MSGFEPITPRTHSPWSLARHAEDSSGTPEQLLLDGIIRLNDFREDRIAAHIHLSSLQRHHRKDHYLKLATDMFEAHVKTFDGHLFILSGGDLFFLAKGMKMEALIGAVDRLRLLFAEDPLAQYTPDAEAGGFVTYYDFMRNFDKLRQDVLTLFKASEKARKDKKAEGKTEAPHGRMFESSDLTKLIHVVERADLSAILRRQTACSIDINGIPQPLFEERFVSIDDLQRICTPDIDLLSDRWLFHYLTRTLDKRVLVTMAEGNINKNIPFSLNLNISTLLSPEFRRFDDLVPQNLRGKAVIEIHKVDVFADIGAYIFARDFLHDRGYKLCLDGLTHHTLPFFDHNRLSLDYFKIYWGPEGLNTAHPSSYADIAWLLKDFGPTRTILCRAESEEALKVGRELGITQFQGRYIDRLLAAAKK